MQRDLNETSNALRSTQEAMEQKDRVILVHFINSKHLDTDWFSASMSIGSYSDASQFNGCNMYSACCSTLTWCLDVFVAPIASQMLQKSLETMGRKAQKGGGGLENQPEGIALRDSKTTTQGQNFKIHGQVGPNKFR